MTHDAWRDVEEPTRQAVADLYRSTATLLASGDLSRAEIMRRFEEEAGLLQERDIELDVLVDSLRRPQDSEDLGVLGVAGKAGARPSWGCPVAGCTTLVKGDHTRPTGRTDCAAHPGTPLTKRP